VTGDPNGLAVDRDGVFWVADTRPPALSRLEPDGRFERVLTSSGEEPFVYPNDLCFGPDGMLYMTESGISDDDLAPGGAFRDDWRTVAIDGRVYRIDPRSLEIEPLTGGIRYANGLAFGPDNALYVAETLSGAILRYEWEDGSLGPASVFGNVNDPATPDDRLHGRDTPPVERKALTAGPLAAELEAPDLRYVAAGDLELLRRLFVAVRDRNWGTVPPTLSNVELVEADGGFAFRYDAHYVDAALGIDFSTHGEIAGASDGTLTCTLDGEANVAFDYNRIGWCVLHPAEVAGRPYRARS